MVHVQPFRFTVNRSFIPVLAAAAILVLLIILFGGSVDIVLERADGSSAGVALHGPGGDVPADVTQTGDP